MCLLLHALQLGAVTNLISTALNDLITRLQSAIDLQESADRRTAPYIHPLRTSVVIANHEYPLSCRHYTRRRN